MKSPSLLKFVIILALPGLTLFLANEAKKTSLRKFAEARMELQSELNAADFLGIGQVIVGQDVVNIEAKKEVCKRYPSITFFEVTGEILTYLGYIFAVVAIVYAIYWFQNAIKEMFTPHPPKSSSQPPAL